MKTSNHNQLTDFSLVLGGPLYQLYLRTRLAKPPLELLHRRIISFVLITWAPLWLLTVIGGHTLSGVTVPFLFDLDAHARFLASLPLLIAAELFVHQRKKTAVEQFTDRGLIAPEDLPRFEAAIASSTRLRNSVIIEVLLLVIAFIGGHWLWNNRVALRVATWYGKHAIDGTVDLMLAGYWYAFVSLPILRFIFLRWYFRLFIWYRFAWQVARLPLHLNTLHPDRAGGLGFLNRSVFAFAPVLLAHAVFLAAAIANRIWNDGAQLSAFKLEVAGILIFLLLLVLVPLTFFSSQLLYAKRRALREYGNVASIYVRDFREKWLEGQNPEGEQLLGTGDIQSLADLGNSFAVTGETRLVPFSKEDVFSLAILLAVPLLPLLLFVFPLEEMIDRIVGLLL